MNNIDILEEKIKIIESLCTDDCINKETVIKPLKYAISTLIEENKKLKEEREELKRENLEIRDWKYVIDSPIDLDKLKELDLIKIKGKEYISKSKVEELLKEIQEERKIAYKNFMNKKLKEFLQ